MDSSQEYADGSSNEAAEKAKPILILADTSCACIPLVPFASIHTVLLNSFVTCDHIMSGQWTRLRYGMELGIVYGFQYVCPSIRWKSTHSSVTRNVLPCLSPRERRGEYYVTVLLERRFG